MTVGTDLWFGVLFASLRGQYFGVLREVGVEDTIWWMELAGKLWILVCCKSVSDK